LAAHLEEFLDGLPEMSNCYCHPGKAGGSPFGNSLETRTEGTTISSLSAKSNNRNSCIEFGSKLADLLVLIARADRMCLPDCLPNTARGHTLINTYCVYS
jgi:hypothetical protein